VQSVAIPVAEEYHSIMLEKECRYEVKMKYKILREINEKVIESKMNDLAIDGWELKSFNLSFNDWGEVKTIYAVMQKE
jgi:hypothetical protein